jgi:hypothetical protein
MTSQHIDIKENAALRNDGNDDLILGSGKKY